VRVNPAAPSTGGPTGTTPGSTPSSRSGARPPGSAGPAGGLMTPASRKKAAGKAVLNSFGIVEEPAAPKEKNPGHVITMGQGAQTELIEAIRRVDLLEVLHLIKKVPVRDRVDYVNQHDSEGNPLIHQAVYYEAGATTILTLLLDYGANPDLQNNRRNTAMHLACQLNHRRAIRQLIMYGAEHQCDNWEHLHPYQMVSDVKEEQAVMQNYVNTCFEKFEELVEAKTIIRVMLPMRSYYRSVFDDIDQREKGYIEFIEIRHFLESLRAEGGVEPAPPLAKQYFEWWNRTKDGRLIFQDFLHGIAQHVAEEEKKKKKMLKIQARLARKKKAQEKAKAEAGTA